MPEYVGADICGIQKRFVQVIASQFDQFCTYKVPACHAHLRGYSICGKAANTIYEFPYSIECSLELNIELFGVGCCAVLGQGVRTYHSGKKLPCFGVASCPE